nr:MAG TPA: hypothetical protein [Caudoviricetes sp.]
MKKCQKSGKKDAKRLVYMYHICYNILVKGKG